MALTDIQELFADIIDTPAKRRREVEEAGARAADLFANQRQRGGNTFGFGGSTLSAAIAQGIPQNTENVRRSLIGMGAEGLQTQGESLADQLRNMDLTDPAQQELAIQHVMQVDPGAGAALEDAYVRRDLERQQTEASLANRYQVNSRQFDNGVMFNQTARGDMTMVIPSTDDSPARTITDPELISLEYAKAEAAEAKTDTERTVAQQRLLAEAGALEARAEEAITRANTISTSLNMYDEAYDAISEGGAAPGVVARWTPSIFLDARTKEFKNIASRMGLAVISGVTFGALSEREMATAMSVAMPDDLNTPEEYMEWIDRRRKAERKIMQELINYAHWIRTEGRDISIMEQQDLYTAMRQAQESASPDPDVVSGAALEPGEPTQAQLDAYRRQIESNIASGNGDNNGPR